MAQSLLRRARAGKAQRVQRSGGREEVRGGSPNPAALTAKPRSLGIVDLKVFAEDVFHRYLLLPHQAVIHIYR